MILVVRTVQHTRHLQQREKKMKVSQRLHAWVLVALMSGLLGSVQLEAADNCAIDKPLIDPKTKTVRFSTESEYKVTLNSSSPNYKPKKKRCLALSYWEFFVVLDTLHDTYYVRVTEPGTVTIKLPSSAKGVKFGYSDKTCPKSCNYTTKTITFDKPTDFNLKVAYRNGYSCDRGYCYYIDIRFKPKPKPAPKPPLPTYTTAPFDAWDTFRGDTTRDGKFDDKHISTKIAGVPFKLTLANLDKGLTRTKLKEVDSHVTFSLYDDKGKAIPGTSKKLNIKKELQRTETFVVPYASRKVTVKYRFCSKYDGTSYTLHKDAECSGGAIGCKTVDKNRPRWRICSASDPFAVRPQKFVITPPSGKDAQLLTSGVAYPFSVVATNPNGTNTKGYNQSGERITLDRKNSLILANGKYDTKGLLSGKPTLNNKNYFFIDGRSHQKNSKSTEVVQMSYDDVGKVTFRLVDPEWSSIDRDDTPQNCNGGNFTNAQKVTLRIPHGAYICGEQSATFIPASFGVTDIRLRNHNKGNFTYLSNDLDMSAHVEAKISARNAKGNITQNFRSGKLFYENPVTVTLDVTDWNTSIPKRHPLGNRAKIRDISKPVLLGFGKNDTKGVYTFASNEHNPTQRLMFNYDRKNNQPVNPFMVPGSDIKISVASTYQNSKTKAKKTVKGSSRGDARSHATFYYARAKASQELYDAEGTVANTPITVQIYCNNSDDFQPRDRTIKKGAKLFCTSFLSDKILTLGQTNQHGWWLSLDHNKADKDGNIKLKNPPTAILGSGRGSVKTGVSFTKGVDSTIQTKHLSGARPITYDIALDTSSSTNSWLIYNPNSPTLAPKPFFRVRFLGDSEGWAGAGKTGHVLDVEASKKDTKRLNW